MDRKNELLYRVYLVMLFFIVVAIMILYRVIKINVFEGEKWRQKNDVHVQWKPVEADRGNIFAEDGSLLATSLPFFDVHMDMTRVSKKVFDRDVDSLAYLLSVHVPRSLTEYEWKQKLINARRKKNQYFFIARGLTINQRDRLATFPMFKMGRYRGGFIVERYTKREKPFKSLASRTIGVDRENSTNVGLEGSFDKFLKGNQSKILKRKVNGEWVPVFDPTESQPQRGNDIVTTINVNMQDVVHSELIQALQKYEAESGVAILMEVKTGAIKAISNISLNKSGYYGEFYNTAIGASTEPGSTMKLASTMALLDDGFLTLDDLVDVNYGKMKFYDRWMRDSHSHPEKYMDLRSAFEESSNVGISSAAYTNYRSKELQKAFVQKYYQFGLNEKTRIEIVGEGSPKIKHPEKDAKEWYGTTIPWMSHGYEMQMTPLQVLNFYNAVANDGELMKPYLVSAIEDDGIVVKEFKPRVLKRSIAKPETIAAAQELLRGVVLRGTARRLHTEEFSFAGKTGTTRVGYWKEGEKKYNASFAGYFPAGDPKYSMIVVIYKPSGAYYGSTVAAPVFKGIAEKCFALDVDLLENAENKQVFAERSLPGESAGYKEDFERVFEFVGLEYKNRSKSKWVEVDSYEDRMMIDAKDLKKDIVPDVRGMGARDAVYVLENLGLQVDVNGLGKVVKQSIRPGKAVEGQEIKIFLN